MESTPHRYACTTPYTLDLDELTVPLKVQEVLAPSTAVVLDTGEYRTLIRRDGSFVLQVSPISRPCFESYPDPDTWYRHDVKQGAYVLQVQSRTHIFDPVSIPPPTIHTRTDTLHPQIYITVTNSSIHLQPYNPSHTPLTPTSTTPSLPYPIQLVPLARIQYYEQPQGANIMGLLKNPMVLMLAFTGIMAFVMPKMLVRPPISPSSNFPIFPLYAPLSSHSAFLLLHTDSHSPM